MAPTSPSPFRYESETKRYVHVACPARAGSSPLIRASTVLTMIILHPCQTKGGKQEINPYSDAILQIARL